jgi:hypothetical protein
LAQLLERKRRRQRVSDFHECHGGIIPASRGLTPARTDRWTNPI